MSDASQAPDPSFPYLDSVEIYDGAGRHLGGLFPPLLEGNVLTPACTLSKALRPGVSAALPMAGGRARGTGLGVDAADHHDDGEPYSARDRGAGRVRRGQSEDGPTARERPSRCWIG